VLPVLACRPLRELGAGQPRPEAYWPDDLPALAEALLAGRRNGASRCRALSITQGGTSMAGSCASQHRLIDPLEVDPQRDLTSSPKCPVGLRDPYPQSAGM
jgi:hypothetical protein